MKSPDPAEGVAVKGCRTFLIWITLIWLPMCAFVQLLRYQRHGLELRGFIVSAAITFLAAALAVLWLYRRHRRKKK